MSEKKAAKKILVVEDDDMIREAMKLFLELEGYQVFTAPDGKQAIDQLARIPAPELILLDLMMPVMDGYEFLKFRKGSSSISQIPVVVVSAFFNHAPDLDVQGFVAKPIDFGQLLELIARYAGGADSQAC